MTNIITVNDSNFHKDVLDATLALVDFWAPWCGPCKMMAPIFDAVAADYAPKLVFAKLNVDESPDTSSKYGVRGIPALLLFKKGNVQATKVGLVSRAQLIDFLEENI